MNFLFAFFLSVVALADPVSTRPKDPPSPTLVSTTVLVELTGRDNAAACPPAKPSDSQEITLFLPKQTRPFVPVAAWRSPQAAKGFVLSVTEEVEVFLTVRAERVPAESTVAATIATLHRKRNEEKRAGEDVSSLTATDADTGPWTYSVVSRAQECEKGGWTNGGYALFSVRESRSESGKVSFVEVKYYVQLKERNPDRQPEEINKVRRELERVRRETEEPAQM